MLQSNFLTSIPNLSPPSLHSELACQHHTPSRITHLPSACLNCAWSVTVSYFLHSLFNLCLDLFVALKTPESFCHRVPKTSTSRGGILSFFLFSCLVGERSRPKSDIFRFNVLPGAAKWCSVQEDGYTFNPGTANICPAKATLSETLNVAPRRFWIRPLTSLWGKLNQTRVSRLQHRAALSCDCWFIKDIQMLVSYICSHVNNICRRDKSEVTCVHLCSVCFFHALLSALTLVWPSRVDASQTGSHFRLNMPLSKLRLLWALAGMCGLRLRSLHRTGRETRKMAALFSELFFNSLRPEWTHCYRSWLRWHCTASFIHHDSVQVAVSAVCFEYRGAVWKELGRRRYLVDTFGFSSSFGWIFRMLRIRFKGPISD